MRSIFKKTPVIKKCKAEKLDAQELKNLVGGGEPIRGIDIILEGPPVEVKKNV